MKLVSPPAIALVIIVGIILGVTIYSGVIPPASVVESGSMQHSDNWQFGVINTGDIVIVKKVSNPQTGIVTYVQGRDSNFSTYGDYGNVILYDAPGGLVVIHRAMFYLTWSHGLPVIPGYHNQTWMNVTPSYVLIKDVGFTHRNLVVYINDFHNESGFITMGDHNLAISTLYNSGLKAYIAADENVNIIGHPVTPSEVIGKAVGQIPWFGLIKLNVMRLQGDWPYSSDVPNHSYEYLGASILVIGILIFFPYSRLTGIGQKKSKKNNKK